MEAAREGFAPAYLSRNRLNSRRFRIPIRHNGCYTGLCVLNARHPQHLVGRIDRSACLLVVGPCGCGKSSLVRAGLLPALTGGALPSSARWRYAVMAPGRAPLRALGQALASLIRLPEAAGDLVQHAASDEARLATWLKAGFEDDADRRAVLVVDPFEEIFTQVDSEAERQVVIAQLCTALQEARGLFRLVLTLRSDFTGALSRDPALNALVGDGLIQVDALSAEDVVRVVTLPAQRVGVTVEASLVARIVADLSQEPEALPLLQFALLDLFKTQRDRHGVPQLTLEGYLRRGGLQHALRRHADAVFDGFSPTQQTIARRLLRSLIEVHAGQTVTRKSVQLAELSFPATPATAVHDVVHQLLRSQLLTQVDGQVGLERAITLGHETLLKAWPLMSALVVEAQTGQRLLATLADAAAEWDESGQDPEFLLAGTRWVHLRRFLADWDVPTPPTVQAYLRASWAHGPGPSEETKSLLQRPSWFREGRAFVARYWQTFHTSTSARSRLSGSRSRNPSERGGR